MFRDDETQKKLKIDKETARVKARSILSGLKGSRRNSAGAAAINHLKTTFYWENCRSLLAYLSFGVELNVDPLIQVALNEGKNVYVPRVSKSGIDFFRIRSLSEPLESGVFGIREPSALNEKWNLQSSPEPSLILVPGLSFDLNGGRLGRGGAYYDRFISALRKEADAAGLQPPLCLGIAYRNQVVEKVPTGKRDEILDGLLTDDFSGLF